MIFLNQSLYVRNYNLSDWEVLDTSEYRPNGDRSWPHKCGIWALLNSLKNQYLDDPEAAALNYESMHQAVRDAKAYNDNAPLWTHAIWSHTYSDIELAQGLQTLGYYKLVKCYEVKGQQVAVRVRSWFIMRKMFICILDLPQKGLRSCTGLP
jgi:hypothetical protein